MTDYFDIIMYSLFCLIFILSLLIINKQDKEIQSLKDSSDFWYKKYSEFSDRNRDNETKIEEYENIFENIKNSLPF